MMQLYTPTSILACVTDDEGIPIDCFADAVPGANPYKETLVDMLWTRYRYSMINSVCLDRWLQRLKDRALLIDRRYQLLIAEYEANKDKLASIQRAGYSETYHDETTDSSEGSDIIVNKREDIPQSAGASSEEWLSARDTSTSTPGVTTRHEADGTRTVSESDALNSEQYGKVMRSLKDPYVAYADEFEELFVNYFDMTMCGCDCSCL